MLNKEQVEKIEKVLSFLTEEDKQQRIINVSNSKNDYTELIKYLESIGDVKIKFKELSKNSNAYLQEIEGEVYLWHKDINNSWMILLYNIIRIN